MSNLFVRLIRAALAAACLVGASSAEAAPSPAVSAVPASAQTAFPTATDPVPSSRPLSVTDLTGLEAFGRGSISPDGRWAVYEKRGPYETISNYDFAQRSPWAIMDLWRIDLADPAGAPERLLPGQGPGLLRGDWSPSGRRLLVYRFDGERYEAGIVDVADRSVAWTGLTPEIPVTGPTARWVSDDQVLLLTVTDGRLPALMRYFGESQRRTIEAWARTTVGREPSRTVLDADGGVVTAAAAGSTQTLFILDVSTGERRSLAAGRIVDFELSPDAAQVAVVTEAEPVGISSGAILQADNTGRQRLSLVDLGTGEAAAPIPTRDVAPYLLRWSPDGRALLVWARPDGTDWPAGNLMRVDRSRATVFDLGDLSVGSGAEIMRGVHADWIGDVPMVLARHPGTDRSDWYALPVGQAPEPLTQALASPPVQMSASKGQAVGLFADKGFWRLSLQGLERLTPSDLPVTPAVPSDPERPNRLRINEARREPWAAALGPQGESLVLDLDGNVRALGRQGDETPRILAIGPDAALVLGRDELVETLRIRTPDGEVAADRTNGRFGDVVLTRPVSVSHRDALGREARSWLFLPARPDGASIRGLIVKVYPGSLDTGAWSGPLSLTYGTRAEVLAGQGYAVLSPAMPIDAPGSNAIDFYIRSVDLAVEAALSAYPDLPRDRVAILGHSFGGYAALAIATRSDRYRTYVASSAITDLFGQWGEFDPASRILAEDFHLMRNQQGWVEVGQGERGGPPWSNIQAYADFSPFLAADRITAPVLLISADRDYIPLSQSERMFSALYRRGGRTRLVTYWGEHHAEWSPANIRDRYFQILDWLEKTMPDPPSSPVVPPRPEPRPRTPPRP